MLDRAPTPASPSPPLGEPPLDGLAEAFAHLELVVVGDAILDVYLRGPVHR
ncbi:MAG: hypothetical protein H0U79_00345, partial [Solirubrobacterales bacterium]|nr:hypothetical protein [Solirubrobacterales bacterium]